MSPCTEVTTTERHLEEGTVTLTHPRLLCLAAEIRWEGGQLPILNQCRPSLNSQVLTRTTILWKLQRRPRAAAFAILKLRITPIPLPGIKPEQKQISILQYSNLDISL